MDGEATEPMIKEVDEDREESQDPEVEFAITSAVRECGGLEILLSMVQVRMDLHPTNLFSYPFFFVCVCVFILFRPLLLERVFTE